MRLSSPSPGTYTMTWDLSGRFEIHLPPDCDASDLAALRPIVEAVRRFALKEDRRPA